LFNIPGLRPAVRPGGAAGRCGWADRLG